MRNILAVKRQHAATQSINPQRNPIYGARAVISCDRCVGNCRRLRRAAAFVPITNIEAIDHDADMAPYSGARLHSTL